MKRINVLMSTYNGERYLRTQIDSILAQENVIVHLFIRDDASTDSTKTILKEYEENFDNIRVIYSNSNLGACRSFFWLMRMDISDGDYFALADQDDFWHKDKLYCAVKMLEEYSEEIAMYHSNLSIVDESGLFLRLSHSVPQVSNNRLSFISENLATGCTVVYNRKMADLILKKQPENYSMHDTWLFSVASLFGKVVYDFQPHIDYRVHGKNAVGASKRRISFESLKLEFKRIFCEKYDCSSDAGLLLGQFNSELSDYEKNTLCLASSYRKSFKKTICLMKDKSVYPITRYRRLRFKAKVLFHTF